MTTVFKFNFLFLYIKITLVFLTLDKMQCTPKNMNACQEVHEENFVQFKTECKGKTVHFMILVQLITKKRMFNAIL
jgi:hypothetical protein